ncbi:MAG: LamG domain-containing protein, partial [bacterium]|nr:LamG domain-containing protein [bacterium]
TGWEYRCSNSANYRKVDSTGWIPVPFTSISFGSNLAILPIDPINTTSTGNYYTYVMGGSYKLTALFESERYKMGGSMDKTSKDNGSYPELLEIGTNLTLLPVSRNPSLVGYWKFNETSGTNAYDASGRGNNGTLTNGPTWTTGKVGGALSFDGVDDYVDAGNAASLNITGEITLEAWIYTTTYAYPTNEGMIVNKENSYEFAIQKTTGALIAAIKDSNPWAWRGSIVVPLNQWKHLTITYAANVEKHYIDSILVESFALSGGLQGSAQGLRISARGAPGTPTSFFNGIIDEVRIYNRALSAAEISAIYNATQ